MSAEELGIRVTVRASGGSDPEGAASNPVEPKYVQTPFIDIHEEPSGLILEADLPGVASEDVSIQLEENVLNLRAGIRVPLPEEARLLHQEFLVSGEFQRSFILSDEVDRNRISAEFKNGVLRLILPKAERSKPRAIPIRTY